MGKTFDEANFDSIVPFEDEIDCAIIGDEDFNAAMEEINNADSTAEDLVDDEEELVDVNIDYEDNIPDADIVDMDADDVIAAERDITFDPFGEDEIIDIATSGSELDDDELIEEE